MTLPLPWLHWLSRFDRLRDPEVRRAALMTGGFPRWIGGDGWVRFALPDGREHEVRADLLPGLIAPRAWEQRPCPWWDPAEACLDLPVPPDLPESSLRPPAAAPCLPPASRPGTASATRTAAAPSLPPPPPEQPLEDDLWAPPAAPRRAPARLPPPLPPSASPSRHARPGPDLSDLGL